MTNTEIVRLKAGDRSSLMRDPFDGDGSRVMYGLQKQNVTAMRVYVNNTLLTTGFTLDAANGTVLFDLPPIIGDTISFEYYWSVYSDDELTQFLDEAGGNTDLSAAKMLLSWAANAARLAMRETLNGGGGVGTVTRDTSLVAQELRATAKVLMELSDTPLSGDYASEGLTEIAWTDFQREEIIEQDIIRNWPN